MFYTHVKHVAIAATISLIQSTVRREVMLCTSPAVASNTCHSSISMSLYLCPLCKVKFNLCLLINCRSCLCTFMYINGCMASASKRHVSKSRSNQCPRNERLLAENTINIILTSFIFFSSLHFSLSPHWCRCWATTFRTSLLLYCFSLSFSQCLCISNQLWSSSLPSEQEFVSPLSLERERESYLCSVER